MSNQKSSTAQLIRILYFARRSEAATERARAHVARAAAALRSR